MLELLTRVTYFYFDPVEFYVDNQRNLQNGRLALRLFFEQDSRSLNPLKFKVRDYGSHGRNAGEHRVRPLPDRASSPRAPHHFRTRLPVYRRDQHGRGALIRRPSLGTAVPVSAPPRPPANLAEPVSELIGRDAEFEEMILDLIAAHRLVT